MADKRVYNFSAGPSTLFMDVLTKAQGEFLNCNGTGQSICEMSHRSKEYMAIHTESIKNLRILLKVPENYDVCYMHGGGTGQFAAVPLNMLHRGGKEYTSADYVVGGNWAKKAYAEAKKYCDPKIIAGTDKKPLFEYPEVKDWKFNADAAYVHITSNETIGGLEYFKFPEIPNNVPLVCDTSSDFLSRPLDVSKFSVLYGGAQKNVGPAGLGFLVIDKNIQDTVKPLKVTPSILDYTIHKQDQKPYNTPNCFAIYMAGLLFSYLNNQGGLETVEKWNIEKSELLYGVIDDLDIYSSPVKKEFRSRMNVPFLIKGKGKSDDENKALQDKFKAEAAAAGMVNLGGHVSVGGLRASIYNAMSKEGVEKLVEFMKEFASKNN